MYAKLRMKQAFLVPTTALATATSEGTKAFSVMIKQVAKLLTGQITSVSQLNTEIWDTAYCEIIPTVNPGWSEYQTTYLSTSTDLPISTSAAPIYLRAPAQGQTLNGQPVYKYLTVGPTGAGGGIQSFHICPVMDNISYVGNPTLSWVPAPALGAVTSYRTMQGGFTTGYTAATPVYASELTISASPFGIFVAACCYARNAQPYNVTWILDHPPTQVASQYAIPCIVFSKTFSNLNPYSNTPAAGSTSVTGTAVTNTLDSYFMTTSTIPNSAFGLFKNADDNNNPNTFAAVTASVYPGTQGATYWTSLFSNVTVNSDVNLSTLKPNGYSTTMSSTMLDSNGNSVSFPMLPLWYWPVWDSMLDLSVNSGVYMTKTGLGSTGDDLTINGVQYAYVNSSPMGYLIPKR